MQPLQLGLMINDSHRSSEVVAHIDNVSLINSMIGAIVPGVSSQVFVGGISFLVMISESGLRTDASFLAFALVTGASLLLNPALQHRPLPLLLSAICTGSPVSPTQGLAQHDYQGSCSQPGHGSTPEAFTNRHDRRRWDRDGQSETRGLGSSRAIRQLQCCNTKRAMFIPVAASKPANSGALLISQTK